MIKYFRTSISPLNLVLAIGFLLIAAAATNDTATETATGAFTELNTLGGEAAPTPETTAEETNTVDLQQGLQGYWRFDNPKVSRGNSIEFDGSDDYVDLPGSVMDLNEGEPITVTAWIKGTQSDAHNVIVGHRDPDNCCLKLELDDGHFSVESHGSGGTDIDGTKTVNDGEWHFGAFTYQSDGTTTLYADGVSDGKSSGDNNGFTASETAIGRRGHESSEHFKGKIDEVRIYNRSLSGSEIEDLYNERPVSREGLILHQDFNEGPKNCDLTSSNDCLTDDSNYNNAGSPQNFDDNNLATGSGWIQETPVNRPTVKDYSSNSYIGTFYGGNDGVLNNFNASSGWRSGKIGKYSLAFDGINDFVRANNSILKDPSKGSVSLWFNRTWSTNDGITHGVFSLGEYESSSHQDYKRLQIFKYGGNNDWYFRLGDDSSFNQITVPDSDISKNEWHHAAMTWHNSEVKVYLDGNYLGSFSETPPDQWLNNNITIGKSYEGGLMQGKIDDVRVYNRVISSSEVESIYREKSATKGIVGRWNFEAGDRKTAYDTSSFDRTGILGTSGVSFESENIESFRDLNVDNSVTISSWVKTEEDSSSVSGGDEEYYVRDNGTLYRVHAFTDTGESNFNVTNGEIEADVLVVAGGGGGGSSRGSGGGAGGVIYEENKVVSGQVSVNVGAGGQGADYGTVTYGSNGENSSFGNLEAKGGGAGAGYSDDGKNGGSGGGGGTENGVGGNGTEGQGKDGGDSDPNCGESGIASGGGGAGSKGDNGLCSNDVIDQWGDGGEGVYYGAEFGENVGFNGHFAGGGGGGTEGRPDISYPDRDPLRSYGKAGGGDSGPLEDSDGNWAQCQNSGGGNDGNGEDAIDGTGSGGGGGNYDNCAGGDGGSGIVLVRYPVDTVVSVNDAKFGLGFNNGELFGAVGVGSLDSGPLGSKENPASSCKEILDLGYSEGNGEYWIATPGETDNPVKTYCDMESDGGGWTLVASNYFDDDTLPTDGRLRSDSYKLSRSEPLYSNSGEVSPESDYIIGNQIVDMNFEEVRITGWGWNQMGENPITFEDGYIHGNSEWLTAQWTLETEGRARLTESTNHSELDVAQTSGMGFSGNSNFYILDAVSGDANDGYDCNNNQCTVGAAGVANRDGNGVPDPGDGTYTGHGNDEGSHEGWYSSSSSGTDSQGYATWVREKKNYKESTPASSVSTNLYHGWQLATLTYDNASGKLKILINGKRGKSKIVNSTFRANEIDFEIGKNLNGKTDEIRIYNRSLSKEEVRRLAFQ